MKAKVLIVDDDVLIADSICLALEDEGYNVTLGSKMIVRDAASLQPDVIMLDIWLWDQDGTTICQILKNDTRTAHIPVLLMSANHRTKRLARQCKADSFMYKPFDISELLDALKMLLKN